MAFDDGPFVQPAMAYLTRTSLVDGTEVRSGVMIADRLFDEHEAEAVLTGLVEKVRRHIKERESQR